MENKLILRIAGIGRKNPSKPVLKNINVFEHYFDIQNKLKYDELSKLDGSLTRRELIVRFLLLNAVLDQGPDLEGVRKLLINVVNELYKKEIRILHRPLDFFKELGISIDSILRTHKSIKEIRSEIWAKENNSNAERYNLFMDNTKQVLNYAVFRWGVPLCVPLLIEKDKKYNGNIHEYLESFVSAEIMSREIKDNERYGLGKAIGDKAGHLFAKWFVHSFKMTTKTDKNWGAFSYELPFDSNAGRVLFRTGIISDWVSIKELIKYNVVQKGEGKGGKHYIRVTNLRGKKSEILGNDEKFFEKYKEVVTEQLKTQSRPRTVQLQQVPNVLLLDSNYGIGDLDDGLIYIGTNFCFNHENPKCSECPIKNDCVGFTKNKELITEYRT